MNAVSCEISVARLAAAVGRTALVRPRRRRLAPWLGLVVGAVFPLLDTPAAGADPAAAPEATAKESPLELRRGARVIVPRGHDIAPATAAAGDKAQAFVYVVTNRGTAPLRFGPLQLARATNCTVAPDEFAAGEPLAAGASREFTVRVTPRDRGPWRALVALAWRDAAGTDHLHPWTIAAPGP